MYKRRQCSAQTNCRQTYPILYVFDVDTRTTRGSGGRIAAGARYTLLVRTYVQACAHVYLDFVSILYLTSTDLSSKESQSAGAGAGAGGQGRSKHTAPPKRQLALPLEEKGSLVSLSKEARDRGHDERLISVSKLWRKDPKLAILVPPLSKSPQLEPDDALAISAVPRVAQFR